MKARFLLFGLAAAMMTLMASCDPEPVNPPDNGGGEGGDPVDTENMFHIGNFNNSVTSELFFSDYGTAQFTGIYETDECMARMMVSIGWETLERTIDLANPQANEDYWIRYEYGTEDDWLDFTQGCTYGEVSSWLNHSDKMTEPIFSTGTLTTIHTDEGYTLTIDGTLTNGTSVLVRLKVPFTEVVVPLTENSVIYDGVKYQFSTIATQDGGTSNVSWTSTGDNNVSSSGTIYYGSNNLHIFLQDNPNGGGYYFDFSINVPGLQLSYSWSNDQLTGTLNGEPFTSTPFTEGDASIGAYYNEMSVTVIGKLNNGKVLKLWVASPY